MLVFLSLRIAFASRVVEIDQTVILDLNNTDAEQKLPQVTGVDACYRIVATGTMHRYNSADDKGGYVFSAEYTGSDKIRDKKHHSLTLTSGFRQVVLVSEDRAADRFDYLAIGDGKTVAARVPQWGDVDRYYGSSLQLEISPLAKATCEPMPEGDSIAVSVGGVSVTAENETVKAAADRKKAADKAAAAKRTKSSATHAPSTADKASARESHDTDVRLMIGIMVVFGFVSWLWRTYLGPIYANNSSQLGRFAVIYPPPRVVDAANVCAANEAWWLIIPGAWLAAFVFSAASALFTAAMSVLGFVGKLLTYASFLPRYQEDLLVVLALIAFCGFCILSVWFLRQAVWYAVVRSKAVRDDPRRSAILLLTRGIEWWNRNLSLMNDHAAAGGREEVLQKLNESHRKLIAWANKMDKRLQVAPLGSFPSTVGKMPLPELKELTVVVNELKAHSVQLDAHLQLDELERPESVPHEAVVLFWKWLQRLLLVTSPS